MSPMHLTTYVFLPDVRHRAKIKLARQAPAFVRYGGLQRTDYPLRLPSTNVMVSWPPHYFLLMSGHLKNRSLSAIGKMTTKRMFGRRGSDWPTCQQVRMLQFFSAREFCATLAIQIRWAYQKTLLKGGLIFAHSLDAGVLLFSQG